MTLQLVGHIGKAKKESLQIDLYPELICINPVMMCQIKSRLIHLSRAQILSSPTITKPNSNQIH